MAGRTVPDEGNRARKRRLEREEALRLHQEGRIKLLEPPTLGMEDVTVEVNDVDQYRVTRQTAETLWARGAPVVQKNSGGEQNG